MRTLSLALLVLAACGPRRPAAGPAPAPAPEIVTLRVVNQNPQSVQVTVRDSHTGRFWRFVDRSRVIRFHWRPGNVVLVAEHVESGLNRGRPYVLEMGPILPGECYVWTMGSWYGDNLLLACPE